MFHGVCDLSFRQTHRASCRVSETCWNIKTATLNNIMRCWCHCFSDLFNRRICFGITSMCQNYREWKPRHTLLCKSLERVRFNFFHQGCIYLIENTVKTVIMWNIITIWNNCFLFEYIIYLCDGKAEFSAATTPVFSVTWTILPSSKYSAG